MVLRLLFNCAAEPGKNPDNIVANEVPGVFGYVRAYFGVVEPQKRKTLHIHMLVQLLGFAYPSDILRDDALPDVCVGSGTSLQALAFATPKLLRII